MNKEKDITGNKYNHLTAIERHGATKDNHPVWLFKCDCGRFHVARKSAVTRGAIRSCGKCVTRCGKAIGHGMSYEKIYWVWHGMRQRCQKECVSHRSRYYDRGITVCEEWNSFPAFWEWAKNNGYKEGLTIDRIDNNKGYCPENCRWTTTYVQARNKRNNINITYNGETHCLKDWADIVNINSKTLWYRYKAGDRGDRLFRDVGG